MRPFVIPVTIMGPRLGKGSRYEALIDLGCTWCLISQAVATDLGTRVKALAKHVRFEQVLYWTELVRLDMAQHWEMIQTSG